MNLYLYYMQISYYYENLTLNFVMEESMSVVLTGTKIGRSNKRPTFVANARKLTDLILSLGGAVGVVWLNQRNRWDESFTYIYLTPRLSEFELFNKTYIIFPNRPVSRLFTYISYNLNFAEEHKWLFSKIRNYDFGKNHILIMNLIVIWTSIFRRVN